MTSEGSGSGAGQPVRDSRERAAARVVPALRRSRREKELMGGSGLRAVTDAPDETLDSIGTALEKTLAFSAVWEQRDGVWKALLHHTLEPK
ncbi:hypothetical protein [Archangium sp.]|uniref:hypothetical protein n=1 Tax=Archangium sp. TaxID=1872627 RepID=UPI002D54394B|nr:hypothetical protein [Archangium sp.]HYO60018.1 hypothetical protein [Archangium sp.]